MSTKTTFKRIALVAVAALGLGVLSVAPSSASVSGLVVTNTNGATTLRSGSTTAVNSDSTTAATIAVSGLLTSALDTVTITFYNKTKPTSAAQTTYLGLLETTTSNLSRVSDAGLAAAHNASDTLATAGTTDSSTAGVTTFAMTVASGSEGNVGAKFALFLDSKTASNGAGTYTYSVLVRTYSHNGTSYTVTDNTSEVSIVVSANTADSTTPSAAYTAAYIATSTPTGEADGSAISAVSTASTTAAAYISVYLKNASNTAGVAVDTITVSVAGPGLIYDGTSYGKSLTGSQTGTKTYSIVPDGNAGVSTITIATTKSAQTWTKSMTFYAAKAASITAANFHPVLKVGANTGAVAVVAKDANGSAWTGTAYIVASSAADALVAGSTTPVQCAAWNSTTGILCPVTALTVGTAKLKVIDASTVALANATSNEITVTVKAQTAASVKLAFDKATYAPNEKAIITVTPVDAAGGTMQGKTWSALLASGGITSSSAFASGSDTLTWTSITTSEYTSAASNLIAGSRTFVVYMPAASGDVKITATGGTDVPAAAQVEVSATATVVNSSVDAATDAANEATDAANAATDAALAAADAADAATAAAQDASDAVAALSASVSKMISNLRAQITSLTNLVIKIQKKVKA